MTPARGATNVAIGANVTAQFSEALTATTVNTTSVVLRDAAGAVVPAAVGYDAGTRTATLDPTAALAAGATYTATVKGGSAGVKDLAGNALAADDSWTFTTRAASELGLPVQHLAGDRRAAEGGRDDRQRGGRDRHALPLRHRRLRDRDPLLQGRDEHRHAHRPPVDEHGPAARDRHVHGRDAPAAGRRRASSAPVAITANTLYVVSYHAPRGNYATTDQQFLSAGVDNPPLHAIRNGDGGGNGVYGYGPERDVPERRLPLRGLLGRRGRSRRTPARTRSRRRSRPGSRRRTRWRSRPASNVTAAFNEGMSAASITTATVQLRAPDGTLVPAAVTYDSASRAATLDPNGDLAGRTRYTVTVKGGSSGVKDAAGNPLAADASWSFTTSSPPGPGPGRGLGRPGARDRQGARTRSPATTRRSSAPRA